VYDDIAKFVNALENRENVCLVKPILEACGRLWVIWKQKEEIEFEYGEMVFKLLLGVIEALQTIEELEHNALVLYLLTFMTDVVDKIDRFEHKGRPYWLFVHVSALMRQYAPPSDAEVHVAGHEDFPELDGPTFELVYKHFAQLVKFRKAGNDKKDKKGYKTLTDLLNECNETWTKATKRGKISKEAAEHLFQNMSDVMLVLEQNYGQGMLVTYLIKFLKNLRDKIENFDIQKQTSYALFYFIKVHIATLYDPESIKKKPKGQKVKLTGLMSELRNLGV
jgi:hypothetical protein